MFTPEQMEWAKQLGMAAGPVVFIVGLLRGWWVMGPTYREGQRRCEKLEAQVERLQMFALESIRTLSKAASTTEQTTTIAAQAISALSSSTKQVE